MCRVGQDAEREAPGTIDVGYGEAFGVAPISDKHRQLSITTHSGHSPSSDNLGLSATFPPVAGFPCTALAIAPTCR
jgi:hypothetical protein